MINQDLLSYSDKNMSFAENVALFKQMSKRNSEFTQKDTDCNIIPSTDINQNIMVDNNKKRVEEAEEIFLQNIIRRYVLKR